MFVIAETLQSGTVDELSERMSISEQREWQEYFKIKDKEQKKARKKARKGKKKPRAPRRARRTPRRR